MTSAEAVEAVVRAGGSQLAELLERTEARLVALAGGHGPTLARHATATISAGGKRLRPLLVFLAAADEPDEREQARLVRAAVAVELIHSASLVHDDVLDGAPLRRGAPTVVAAAGRTIATATGDLLFSRAFAELAADGAGELEDVRALSAAASALAAGELLQRADAWDPAVPLERYLHRCELKTGSLFEAACRLGALATGRRVSPSGDRERPPADDVTRSGDRERPPADDLTEALALFGRRIGLAFQLLDDVLDVSGPASRTGKARGTDLLDGTVTLPLILARERDAQLARLDLRTLRTADDAERLCDRIAATGALDAAKQDALAVVAEARAELPPLPPPRRRALELVAEGVVERYA
jgi:geranylgeranyl pyrophosphate synthase